MAYVTIKGLMGNVHVYRPSRDTQWARAQINMPLHDGDIVITDAESVILLEENDIDKSIRVNELTAYRVGGTKEVSLRSLYNKTPGCFCADTPSDVSSSICPSTGVGNPTNLFPGSIIPRIKDHSAPAAPKRDPLKFESTIKSLIESLKKLLRDEDEEHNVPTALVGIRG